MTIVTIDGPAGAGKSSAARALAKRLGFEFLDTGAMYRAVTLAGLRAKLDFSDASGLASLAASVRLEMPPGRVVLDGEDVTAVIRTKEITAASGAIASSMAVRRWLVELQRQIATGRNMVCEGRDQGTIVFPQALCKFFLTADPVERARRRQCEMAARGETIPFDEVLAAQEDRDRRDAHRDIAPMVPAEDAIVLDTTQLSLDRVVDVMEQEYRKKERGPVVNAHADGRAHRAPPPAPTAVNQAPAHQLQDSAWEAACAYAFYEATYFAANAVMSLGWSLRTDGRRNIPFKGPALLISNHQSFLDPLLIGVSTPRHMRYLARKTLFNNKALGLAIRMLNAVPVDQEGVGKDGLKTMLAQLRLDQAVVVFPEGERTPHGDMLPFKPGIQLLIKRAQAPIIPVGIAGAYDAWPRWRTLPIPAPLFLPASHRCIAVSVGKPLDAGYFAALPREQSLQELFAIVKNQWQCAEKLRRKP